MAGPTQEAMYGTRDALVDWQLEVDRTMKEAGVKQSPTSPCVYFNETTNVRVVDDVLANLRRCLQNKYVIKFLKPSVQVQMKRSQVNSW